VVVALFECMAGERTGLRRRYPARLIFSQATTPTITSAA
jgi:hypothetical protein